MDEYPDNVIPFPVDRRREIKGLPALWQAQ